MPDQRLRRRERLPHRGDFDRVYARQCRAGDGTLLIYVDRNNLGWSRLGLSVGRKAGGAVARNRIRRRIREAFRLSKETLPCGLDIVCVANAQARDDAYDVAPAMRTLVTRALHKLEMPRT